MSSYFSVLSWIINLDMNSEKLCYFALLCKRNSTALCITEEGKISKSEVSETSVEETWKYETLNLLMFRNACSLAQIFNPIVPKLPYFLNFATDSNETLHIY